MGEDLICEKVREIVADVDWPCEVKTLFRKKNLGCKLAVSSAIDWFFENEEEGIILEDDILPLDTFFPYCDELLSFYKNDKRIGLISGCNFFSNYFKPKNSYFFSRYNYIWGWATWRDRWQSYDVEMKDYYRWKNRGGLKSIDYSTLPFRIYWGWQFDRTSDGSINTWDYQWTFACWKNNWKTIIPSSNLISNLGFGNNATHTFGDAPKFLLESTPKNIIFPITHADEVLTVRRLESYLDKYVAGITYFVALKIFLKEMFVRFKKKLILIDKFFFGIPQLKSMIGLYKSLGMYEVKMSCISHSVETKY